MVTKLQDGSSEPPMNLLDTNHSINLATVSRNGEAYLAERDLYDSIHLSPRWAA